METNHILPLSSDSVMPTPDRIRPIAFFLPLILTFSLYLATLSPTISWSNSAEFAIAAMNLDVPHQPGYPLFTRLGHLATQLPFGENPAWRVNLLSAILAAFGLGSFSLWLHATGINWKLATGAALWLASGPVFWQMSTEAEVYSLEILLLMASALLFQNFRTKTPGLIGSAWIGILIGLSVSHRPTLGVTVMVLLPILIPLPRLREFFRFEVLLGLTLGLLLGLAPLVDLFQRLHNPDRQLIDPMIGRGFDGFWKFFTASDFQKALGVFGGLELLARAKHWAWLIIEQGSPALLLLPMLAVRRPPLSREVAAMLWVLFSNTVFVLNYNAYDAHTMLMPSFCALTALSVLGISSLNGRYKAWLIPAFVLLVMNSFLAGSYRVELAHGQCERFTRRLIAMLPTGSSILVNDDLEFRPLLYLRQTEELRPDLHLRLVDAFEESDLPAIAEDLRRGGVFSTLVFPATLAPLLSKAHHLLPWGYLYRIVPAHFTPTPPPHFVLGESIQLSGSATLHFGRNLEVLTHRVPGNSTSTAIVPGDVLQYQFLLASAGSLADSLVIAPFIVDSHGRLPSEKGVLLGNDLHAAGAGLCQSSPAFRDRGERLFSSRQIIIPETLKPGKYEIRLLLTSSADGGLGGILLDRLPNANLLGEEGETELFRLQFGFGLRPFVAAETAGTWNNLVKAGPNWWNASAPLVLGSFEIQSSH